MNNNITYILPIYNEEAKCLKVYDYYSQFFKVLIIDNKSQDCSVQLLKTRGNIDIHTFKNNGTIQTPDFFRFTLPLISTPYFILGSCSELIPSSCILDLIAFATEGIVSMVSFHVVTINNGFQYNMHGGMLRRKSKTIQRFFKKTDFCIGAVKIHSPFQTKSQCSVITLENCNKFNIIHFRESNFKTLLLKNLNYGFVEADSYFQDNKNYTLISLAKAILREILKIIQNNPSNINYFYFRDILARCIMHIVVYIQLKDRQIYNSPLGAKALFQSQRIWQSTISSANEQLLDISLTTELEK